MATLSEFQKKVRNTKNRQSSAFLRVWTGAAFEFRNLGRIMNTSVSAEPVASDADQDGRESSQLFDITASLTLMQGSNEELSQLPELALPSDATNYPNGHTVYFSGSKLKTSELNASLSNDLPDYTVLGVSGGAYDPDGICFENVLLKPSAEINLDGETTVITIEFTGRLPLTAFADMDDTSTSDANTITVSPE